MRNRVAENAGRNSLLLATGVAASAGLAFNADAGNTYRLYDFEEGSNGVTTTTVADSITDGLVVGTNGAAGFYWIEVPGTTPRPLPAGNLQTSVDSSLLAAPALNTDFGFGQATFVSVAGSSPVPGSTLALGFDGATSFNDFSAGGGSRGVYIDAASYDGGTADVIGSGNDTNVFESFSILSQAWVNPNSSAQGTQQVVFQTGSQQGLIGISANGFWEIGAVGGGFPDEGETTVPVSFDEWTHVAVMRGGNGAEFFINGVLVAGDTDPTPPNFFSTFSSEITLGSATFGSLPFTGLVDNFSLTGFADLTYDRVADIDFFDEFLFGDLDQDGDVDDADFAISFANFTGPLEDGDKTPFDGDNDGDGDVDDADFGLSFAAYTGPLNAAEVPEPASALLLILASAATCRRRR